MGDKYIDLEERQIYGTMAARRLAAYAGSIEAEVPAELTEEQIVKAALLLLARHVDEATTDVSDAVAASQAARADVHDASVHKVPVLTQGRQLLGALASHLEEQTKVGKVFDRAQFFKGGYLKNLGRGGAAVLSAVSKAITGCRRYEESMPTLASRRVDLEALLPVLTEAIEDSASAHGDRRTATPEMRAALRAWDVTYASAKDVARGFLTLRGELSRMKQLFHDLAVPAGTRLRSDPGDQGSQPA